MEEQQNPSVEVNPESNGHVARKVEVFDEHEEDRPVQIRGKSGVVIDYVVTEMGDPDLGKWMKILGSRLQTGRNGKPIKQNYEGLQSELIFLCLRTKEGGRVPKNMIAGWGAKTKSRLFAICQEINGLTDKVEEEEGND